MKSVLPVTVHLNLLSVIKKFLQMSHLLQLTIVQLLLMLEHIHYLHSDEVLKVFPNKMFSDIYKRNTNLKEMVQHYLYPRPSIKVIVRLIRN